MSDNACDVELRIPSDLIYLRPVRAFIRELAENADFPHERVNCIELAIDEVFSNAVEHGSVGYKSQIVIHCLSTDEMMRIVVSDAGRGEGPNTGWIDAWANAIREKDRLGTERGHGLLLVYNLTDEMSIEPNLTGGVDVYLVIYKEGQRVAQK